MQIDVLFGSAGVTPADMSGRVVAVIDVLRASTSIAVALENGAKAIVPFDKSEDVVSRAKAFERGDVRLAGERKSLPIPGFDLGNSPLQFTREAVEGRTILMATTNGTGAVTATQGARDVIIASYVNFSTSLSFLRAALRMGTDVVLMCAGQDRQFALEDAACAGRYATHMAKRLTGVTLNDGAQACALIYKKYGENVMKVFDASAHGRALREAGFAEDLAVCAEIDTHGVLPVYQDRQITRLGSDR
ncbi:MAG TPA: 2-phosphosulfolactate phosphatase [Gemmatimonadaceae bacterium]|nr:2-phosphosulfolactate phosphatase [Gemmatimonadaceae bacterium]